MDFPFGKEAVKVSQKNWFEDKEIAIYKWFYWERGSEKHFRLLAVEKEIRESKSDKLAIKDTISYNSSWTTTV